MVDAYDDVGVISISLIMIIVGVAMATIAMTMAYVPKPKLRDKHKPKLKPYITSVQDYKALNDLELAFGIPPCNYEDRGGYSAAELAEREQVNQAVFFSSQSNVILTRHGKSNKEARRSGPLEVDLQ